MDELKRVNQDLGRQKLELEQHLHIISQEKNELQ